MRAHKHAKLLAHRLQHAQPVVLRKSVQEVLHDLGLVGSARVLGELGHDLRFILYRKGGCAQHDLELRVLLEDIDEVVESLGGIVESG